MSPCTIGPRQITGESPSTKKPIDISLRPKASWHRMRLPIVRGRPLTPVSRGSDGP